MPIGIYANYQYIELFFSTHYKKPYYKLLLYRSLKHLDLKYLNILWSSDPEMNAIEIADQRE